MIPKEQGSTRVTDARMTSDADRERAGHILSDLVHKAQSPEVQARFAPFMALPKGASGKRLFDAFQESPLAATFYRNLQALAYDKEISSKSYYRRFGFGQFFELFGYGMLAAFEAKRGNTVIDHEGTMAVWEALYPNAKINSQSNSLLDLYVPDGLIMGGKGSDAGKITGLIECKFQPDLFSDQQLRASELDIIHLGDLAAYPSLVLVTTKKNMSEEKMSKLARLYPAISYLELYVAHNQMNAFVSNFALDNESATFTDIWARRESQEEEGETIVSDYIRAGATTETVVELAQAGVVFDPELYFKNPSTA